VAVFIVATVQIRLNEATVRAERRLWGMQLSLAPLVLHPSVTITMAVEFLVYNTLRCIQGLMVHRQPQILKY
jgi:hypothetical protein